MFVVSNIRFIMLVGLASIWTLLVTYSFFGALFWVGFSLLGAVLPIASRLYLDMHDSLAPIADSFWHPVVLGGGFVVMLGFWFVSIRLLLSYRNRRDTLKKIHNVIQSMPSLHLPGALVGHTEHRSYGSSSTNVAFMGDGVFEIRTTFRTSVGSVNDIFTFSARARSFQSDNGCSEEVMHQVLGILLVQKNYEGQFRQIDEVKQ